MKRPIVYFMMSEFPEGLAVKIGKTMNVRRRLKEIQANTPIPVVLVFAFHGSKDCEALLHRHFADSRIHNEWFRHSDAIEALRVSVMAKLGNVIKELKFEALREILNEQPLHPPQKGQSHAALCIKSTKPDTSAPVLDRAVEMVESNLLSETPQVAFQYATRGYVASSRKSSTRQSRQSDQGSPSRLVAGCRLWAWRYWARRFTGRLTHLVWLD